jgi:hypothetical protein
MNPTVAISGCDADADLKRAFQELTAVLQLRAGFSPARNLNDLVGTVDVSNSAETTTPVPLQPVPKFQFIPGNNAPAKSDGATIEFLDHPILPVFLRRQRIVLGKESGWQFLDDPKLGEVVASINGRPVWRIAGESGCPVWSVSTPLPRLAAGERLSQHFNGETFLSLLPLYLFLRRLSPESRWQAPPLMASLVVDDPNLHARTYGHIDYQSLATLVRKKQFHVAMATIPLDAWWTNVEAARIFRENHRALSLLVHGNDHLHDELARSFHNGERNALVLESLKRIESLEQRAGIGVDRVMAPPHGVCAPEMFDALQTGGYEGMTTNRWSLWKHNPTAQLPASSGLHPADLLGGGLPVLNRFRFKSSICHGECVMAAVLRQPVIAYGHHQDFADGMAHVRAAVETVNSLGAVRWMSLREILESNFEHHIERDTFHVRMFSRRIKFTPPAEITAVQIEKTPFSGEQPRKFEATWPRGKAVVLMDNPVTVPPGVELEIREIAAAPPVVKIVRPAYKSTFVRLRRLVLETRDRLRI